MTSEEYRQMLKEQYKKDLRAQKEFLEKVNKLKQQQSLLKAVEDMSPEDDTDDWLEKLNQETALMEAKTELALNLAEEQKKQLDSLEHQIELEKLAAQQLIIEMKKQMGLLPADAPQPEVPPVVDAPKEETSDTPQDSTPPPILGDF